MFPTDERLLKISFPKFGLTPATGSSTCIPDWPLPFVVLEETRELVRAAESPPANMIPDPAFPLATFPVSELESPPLSQIP